MNSSRNFTKFVFLVFSGNLNISRKKYINGISRLHALKWYIICSYFKSLKCFSNTHSRAIGESFRKNLLIKSRNQNIFEKLKLNQNLQNIPFKCCIICLCYIIGSQMNGGGGGGGGRPEPPSSFILFKVCISITEPWCLMSEDKLKYEMSIDFLTFLESTVDLIETIGPHPCAKHIEIHFFVISFFRISFITLPLQSLLVPTPFTKGRGSTGPNAISKPIVPMNVKFSRVFETFLNVL